ncbi:hypothetical protein CEQ21_23115 [Niallia circulans]|uniref:Uncharacterized protein n=1 Tax=Niallia circulans TaxID=1397 RepID=A0A553SMR8_NIACI|nr:hypothetical protein [Niallia circulans]TRZ38294.1 hypothetical protein CEQ21_23115 [Niallia circulans]
MPDLKNSPVFLPKTNITAATSQTVFQYNYLEAYMAEQQSKNEMLRMKLEDIFLQANNTTQEQAEKLQQLEDLLFMQGNVSNQILEETKTNQDHIKAVLQSAYAAEELAKENAQKLSDEQYVHTAILDQFVFQDKAISNLTETLDEFKQSTIALQEKINQTEETQQQIDEKLELQEIYQQTILEKVEDTDAKISKMARQMEYLKEVIFERIEYLAAKFEDNLKSLVIPVQKFFVKTNEKAKEKK